MIHRPSHALGPAAEGLLGARRWTLYGEALYLPHLHSDAPAGRLSRAEVALGLALVLLDELTDRVPLAGAYLAECALAERRFVFDHGAVRTVAVESGGLPFGREAIARLLEPLGYAENEVYPLDRLGMQGWSFTHRDFPESLPQYFVSELEPRHFGAAFQDTVRELVRSSVDPLPAAAREALDALSREGSLPVERALCLLHVLRAAFDRHHREPTLEEYELLAAESAEMAWISTEGHAFNHVTDRVADVETVAERQRELGRPIKAEVEVSRSGRVRQTALFAAPVERLFRTPRGLVTRAVPGSFLEFITRERLPDGRLDLAFDAGNAQQIFKMTDCTGAGA